MAAPVSVLIPFYNNDDTIDDAVASVRAQTVPPAQIIVVDDCSNPDRATRLGTLGPEVTVLRTPRNGGAGAARNVGLAAVTAPWVALLDADDAWLPTKLERQLAWLEAHPEFDGCQTATILWRNGEDVRTFLDKPELITPVRACLDGNMLPSASIFRTSLLRDLGGWTEARYFLEDWDLTLRAVKHGARLGYVREALVRFRRDGHEHLTQDPWNDLVAHLSVISRNRAYMESLLGAEGLRTKQAKCLLRFARRAGGLGGRLIAMGASRWIRREVAAA